MTPVIPPEAERAVRSLAFKFSKHRAQIDDLIQAGRLGAVHALTTYTEKRGKFLTYAYLRIRGEMLDELARGQVAQGDNLTDGLVDDRAPDPCDVCEVFELEAVVDAAVRALPPRLATLIVLYYTEELTLREIGRRFGVSESRTCVLHQQAIKQLRGMCARA